MKKPQKKPATGAKNKTKAAAVSKERAADSEPTPGKKGGMGGVLGGKIGDRYTVAAATYPPDVPGAVGIGTRLKWGRERRQLASRAVADQIGLSPEGLTFYERDGSIRSMSVDKADKCARYLGLTFEWFCLGIGEPFLDGEIDGVTYNKEAEYQAIRDTRAAIKRQVEMEGSPGVDTELTRMALGIDREKASIARNRRQRR